MTFLGPEIEEQQECLPLVFSFRPTGVPDYISQNYKRQIEELKVETSTECAELYTQFARKDFPSSLQVHVPQSPRNP